MTDQELLAQASLALTRAVAEIIVHHEEYRHVTPKELIDHFEDMAEKLMEQSGGEAIGGKIFLPVRST